MANLHSDDSNLWVVTMVANQLKAGLFEICDYFGINKFGHWE